MKEIKVFLVDDREISREGLARLLREQPSIQLVYKCESNQEVAERVRILAPDVLLIDTDIFNRESLESCQPISRISSATQIAIFADTERKDQFLWATRIGARGYLSKDVPVEELMASLYLVAQGEIVVSPAFSAEFLFSALSDRVIATGPNGKPGLTRRETEVLDMVTRGASNKKIAEKLYIAENTVKVHLKKILEKLQLRNRQQLAVYAIQQGMNNHLQR